MNGKINLTTTKQYCWWFRRWWSQWAHEFKITMSRNENINIHTWVKNRCTYRQISYLCIVRTISVISESEYIYINSAYTCTYCIKTARHMFTLFVHEIVATFYKNTCASCISNRNWQTIPKLTSIIHNTCSIQISVWFQLS